MRKSLDEKVIPKAEGKRTSQADFDRNRDGLYGGLPRTRDEKAPGPSPEEPHPANNARAGEGRGSDRAGK